MNWMQLLRCPTTGGAVRLSADGSKALVDHSDVTYPVIDGIIDFCSESRDRISNAYDGAVSRYDSYITSSSLLLKVVNLIISGHASDQDLLDQVLSRFPDQFDGVLVDVPVGTGVFTSPIYRRYPEATIIGVDYSMRMLQKAKARFEQEGMTNVYLVRANAAHLPLADGIADMVVSMNGWHAFADKRGTTAEMKRVLCEDGKLIACGYIRGGSRRGDWFVRWFGARRGFFTPPFFTSGEIPQQFTGFTISHMGGDRYFAWFEAMHEGLSTSGIEQR